MLTKKFYSKKAPPPPELYYNGVSRTANAGIVNVDANIQADLVIAKRRNGAATSAWFSKLRGALKRLVTSSTAAEVVDTNTLTAFNSTGFTLGADATNTVNAPSGASYMYWCFARAAGYLDVIEFTGDGQLTKTLPHQLTVAPELAIGKSRTGVQLWPVMHKDVGGRDLVFNNANAATVPSGNTKITGHSVTPQAWWGVTYGNGVYVAICNGSATSNVVAVSIDGETWNQYTVTPMPVTGATTGLYGITFFASIGKFVAIGTDSSYTSTDGQTWVRGPVPPFALQPTFEQALASTGGRCVVILSANTAVSTDGLNWTLMTNTLPNRQAAITGAGGTFATLPANNNSMAYWSDDGLSWTQTPVPQSGRMWRHIAGNGSGTFIGVTTTGQAAPADRTNVMVRSIDNGRTWSTMNLATIQSWGGIAYGNGIFLAGGADTDNADDQSNIINVSFDNGNTWVVKSLVAAAYWMYWTYGDDGFVGFSYGVDPNITAQVEIASGSAWIRNPQPATIDVGASFNVLNAECEIALFASKPGVSKVGSYTGNGVNQNIDCGFVGSARFVMIKKWNNSGDWYVWDSARGINIGTNDPYLVMNLSNAEVGNDNAVEPLGTGFIVKQTAATGINESGDSYVYLAIA